MSSMAASVHRFGAPGQFAAHSESDRSRIIDICMKLSSRSFIVLYAHLGTSFGWLTKCRRPGGGEADNRLPHAVVDGNRTKAVCSTAHTHDALQRRPTCKGRTRHMGKDGRDSCGTAPRRGVSRVSAIRRRAATADRRPQTVREGTIRNSSRLPAEMAAFMADGPCRSSPARSGRLDTSGPERHPTCSTGCPMRGLDTSRVLAIVGQQVAAGARWHNSRKPTRRTCSGCRGAFVTAASTPARSAI